ncbi:hypothetical protein PAI11_11330 [Patulibacter medicamentivorans]|uniref:DUF6457 domain-containing protein n=1 Tax=Patulibacter medicamentivorans TaxID=1097667 RepID=H0E2W8_9ACTN|nr:DUF6457 domain-containing protein [Patulibacter medicamentivorans]EHN11985.1 hypothetical protein PAI11_11330 [Patulibacter medicamentivorans]
MADPDTTTIAGWLEAFASGAGAAPPTDEELRQLLDLARHAAHRSQRQAAPIACWIAGRTGRPVAELLALVEADERLRAPDEG